MSLCLLAKPLSAPAGPAKRQADGRTDRHKAVEERALGRHLPLVSYARHCGGLAEGRTDGGQAPPVPVLLLLLRRQVKVFQLSSLLFCSSPLPSSTLSFSGREMAQRQSTP